MAVQRTEEQHPDAVGIDAQAPEIVLQRLADGQVAAAAAVRQAIPDIARAAARAAELVSSGGRLAYAGAGSSGLMALADALELPGTFGIAREQIVVLIAGGPGALSDLAGAPEDDRDDAARSVRQADIGVGDCLIAVSASGSTPYAVGALAEARSRGAATIAIANNADTPLLQSADIGILLATPPELIAGSTRMGAGTAQKIALNMLSSLMAIRLGHVHDGFMVNLHADNAKLKARAARIVSAVANCGAEDAERLLNEAGGSVKHAVLLAAGATDGEAAHEMLEATGGLLRPALSMLEEGGIDRKHGT
ncbi:N-acetylmuramic acid 6-phosphate etherase [Mesorhizobium xinjiangense]|uniref:N-acetylmuramic acid 6-phosphate etherase n=1 Tax=Mesorhizobium xinjiangense TaxID=2678685 RepID=UPI0012EE2469|nr:N-acetylmuramic acid 6-phosphate etherase [Mesorhizobium xinjiangense]